MYSFSGEMWTLADSVKTIVESHCHVGPTVAFTGNPHQHVAQGQTACVTPSGTHKIFLKGSTTLPLCKSGTSEFYTFRLALNGHKKHKRILRGKRGKRVSTSSAIYTVQMLMASGQRVKALNN